MTTDPDRAWAPENVEYWTAARDGRLLVRTCDDCVRPHYYPRGRCPFCAGFNTRWVGSPGRGTVYSFTVMRRMFPSYIPAYVALDEGITLLTHLVDCDPETVRIGQPVSVTFRPVDDGRMAPMFTPSAP